jgi:glycosyltransferase involved in cell wall biosynthesis
MAGIVPRHLIYTAAHGGFAHQRVPLGGGGTVCDQLLSYWKRSQPFESIACVTPQSVTGKELVGYSEAQYARFCREFEEFSTAEVLKRDPRDTAVLVNDISEGPDFRKLAGRGFRIFTIYHVDVVAYVADIYAKGWVSPKTLARAYEYLGWALPDMAKLVFEKQKHSVLYSRKCIVPSRRVKDVLRGCYPQRPEDFVEVVPWGSIADPSLPVPDVDEIRREFQVDSPVILTLSRISPEKGQDQLLAALRNYPDPLTVFICGDPAFMQGASHMAKLRHLAAQLPKHVKVHFPGYVTGERKRKFFALADLYIFPSRHESYGLTLMEALASGLPAVCLDHSGAREIMQDSFGRIVEHPEQLVSTIRELLRSSGTMSEAARQFAAANPFPAAADRIARLILNGQ